MANAWSCHPCIALLTGQYRSVLPSDENFKMNESDQSEYYYPDGNENINSHEEIQKKRRFVIEGGDED